MIRQLRHISSDPLRLVFGKRFGRLSVAGRAGDAMYEQVSACTSTHYRNRLLGGFLLNTGMSAAGWGLSCADAALTEEFAPTPSLRWR
jgi:hypothetical protein